MAPWSWWRGRVAFSVAERDGMVLLERDDDGPAGGTRVGVSLLRLTDPPG